MMNTLKISTTDSHRKDTYISNSDISQGIGYKAYLPSLQLSSHINKSLNSNSVNIEGIHIIPEELFEVLVESKVDPDVLTDNNNIGKVCQTYCSQQTTVPPDSHNTGLELNNRTTPDKQYKVFPYLSTKPFNAEPHIIKKGLAQKQKTRSSLFTIVGHKITNSTDKTAIDCLREESTNTSSDYKCCSGTLFSVSASPKLTNWRQNNFDINKSSESDKQSKISIEFNKIDNQNDFDNKSEDKSYMTSITCSTNNQNVNPIKDSNNENLNFKTLVPQEVPIQTFKEFCCVMIEDNIKTTFDVKEEVFEETRDALNESNEQLLLSLKSPTIVKEVMKKIAFLPCGHDFTTDSNNSVNESSNKSNDCNLSTHSSPKMQLNGYTLNSDNDNEAMLAIQQLDQTIDEASPSNTNSPVIVAKIQDNFKNEQIDQQINNMNNKSNNVKPTKPPRFINYSTIENKQKTLIEINQTQCDNLIEEMYVTDENGSKSNKIIDKCITNHMKSQTLYNNDSNNRQTTHKNEIDLNYNNYNIKQMNIGVSTDLDVAIARASLSSVDSGTSSPNSTHFIVVAIDFGTTFSGYSFAFTRDADNAIHVMRKVEGCDPDASNQKIPTILLLNPDGIFHSFGFASRDHYSSLEPKEANKWFYFEKFKMDLHYNQSLSLESTINATNGNKSMSALTVFAHALRYFKLQALQELSDQSATNILIEDIRWVITVPALWKPSAKQFMRAAAYEAGIGSVDNPSQLLIALEPEAASIYCRRIKLNQLIPSCPPRECQSQSENINSNDDRLAIHWKNDSFSANDSVETSFTKGTKYIVVDVGGGTVDITCHQMQTKEGSLKELHKAIGGPNGSVGVDINFEKLLSDIFGVDFIKQFKNKRPAGYVDLMSAFEARKRSATTYQTTTSNISLPFSFINFFKKSKGMSVDSAVKKYSDGKGITYCSKLGMLRLDPTVMQQLFAPVAKQIISHIWDILNSKHVKDVTFLFLVGGFSESHILQTHIRNAFSSRLKVIIPQSPNLAILRGAVMYGLDPTVISCRRARLTYGVGVLNRFIDGKHPSHKLAIKDNIEWCADVFDKFVNCDQSIGLYESITRSYTPVNEGQSCSIIHIYCSERDDVEFITDKGVQRCGTLYLDLDDINYISHSNHINSAFKTIIKREIQTQMIFGDTEIKVCALDVMTGKCVKAEIDFLNNSNL